MESVVEMSIEELGEWLNNGKFSDNTIQTFKGESTNIKSQKLKPLTTMALLHVAASRLS